MAMVFSRKVLFFAVLSMTLCCSGNEPALNEPAVPVSDPVISIPGSIQLPGDGGFIEMEVEEHDAVLLYCWLPMGNYSESYTDLHFMGTLAELGITPVPVQFDLEVRNAGQNQLNELGLPIAVAFGDAALKSFMDIDVLPVAVLVLSSGNVIRQTGFGCAERAVREVN